MLDEFKIAKFVFDFRAEEPGYLPGYKGGLLRGGFGYAFRSVACHHSREDCMGCGDRDNCAYSYIFETSPEKSEDSSYGYSDVSRPFVVEPGDTEKRDYRRGDPLQFGLVLIGRAIEYLPYFIFCFDELGRRGMGRSRTRFRLAAICGFDFHNEQWLPVYDPLSRSLSDNIPVAHADSFWPVGAEGDAGGSRDILTLEFLTPTRIKYRGKYITDLEFHVIIRNLLRRISMLILFHCHDGVSGHAQNDKAVKPFYTNPDFEAYVNELITEAKMVDVRDWDLKWQDWERYSTRKNINIKLGGFMGHATYIGPLEKFMPIIALGEQIHIGKGTTFGLGKYTIRCEGSDYE